MNTAQFPRWSRLVVTTTVVAISAAGVATALSAGPDTSPAPAGSVASDTLTVSESKPTAAAQAPDTRGGDPWTVAVTRAEGKTCAKPGRLTARGLENAIGGEHGPLLTMSEGALCVDIDAMPDEQPISWNVSAWYRARWGKDPTTFVWGLAKPGVETVDVEAGNKRTRADVGADRGFIAVADGVLAADGMRLLVTRMDGSSVEVIVPVPPEVIRQRMLNPPSREDLADQHEADGHHPHDHF